MKESDINLYKVSLMNIHESYVQMQYGQLLCNKTEDINAEKKLAVIINVARERGFDLPKNQGKNCNIKYFDAISECIYFVGQGELSRKWSTVCQFKNGSTFFEPVLPMRTTREEAQTDLDTYAQDKKLELVMEEVSTETKIKEIQEEEEQGGDLPEPELRMDSQYVEEVRKNKEYLCDGIEVQNLSIPVYDDHNTYRIFTVSEVERGKWAIIWNYWGKRANGWHLLELPEINMRKTQKEALSDLMQYAEQKCLGKMIAATIPPLPTPEEIIKPESTLASYQDGSAYLMPLSYLNPNQNNPRKNFNQETLDELTESVRQVGVIEPLLAVKEDGWYRIVAGERRYRAAQAAGLEKVPVIVRELTDEQEFEIMMAENLHRDDLDPIEEALAYRKAMWRGYTQQELAKRLGITQGQVANRCRLLKLPPKIQENISRKIITVAHGLALLKIAHIPDLVDKVVKEIQDLPVAKVLGKVDHFIKKEGLPLYSQTWNHPKFNTQDVCIRTKCRYRIHAKDGEQEHPYCLNASCWEEHQKDAEKEEEAKQDETVNMGEWADEMQVAAYEEPAAEYNMIGVMLEKEPGCEAYKKITEVMSNDELKEALEAECRPEGINLLKAEAMKRGLNWDEPGLMVAAGHAAQATQDRENIKRSTLSSLELLDFIDLTKFRRGIDYRYFTEPRQRSYARKRLSSQIDPNECFEKGCKHLQQGRTRDNENALVCFKPSCLYEKIKAKEQEQTKSSEELKLKILQDTRNRVLGRDILLYMAAQSVFSFANTASITTTCWNYEKVFTELYGFYGWEIKDDLMSVKNLINNLQTLDDQELLHVIFFTMLRGIDMGDTVYRLTIKDDETEKEKVEEAS